jgi:hypothetical protein
LPRDAVLRKEMQLRGIRHNLASYFACCVLSFKTAVNTKIHVVETVSLLFTLILPKQQDTHPIPGQSRGAAFSRPITRQILTLTCVRKGAASELVTVSPH